MHSADLLASDILCVLEGVAEDALGGFAGDKLDRLDDTVDDYMLDSTVLSLGVLSDQDGVDVVPGGLVADDALAGSNVGEEVECSAESQV